MVGCVIPPIRFKNSLIININGGNTLIRLCDHSFYFSFLSTSFIKLSRDPFSYDFENSFQIEDPRILEREVYKGDYTLQTYLLTKAEKLFFVINVFNESFVKLIAV